MATYSCLVVEDSPVMRRLIVHAVSQIADIEIVEAHDGLEGLKQLATRRFDIILSDINMPNLDGFKLLRKVRQDAATKDLPFMFVTTEGSDDDRTMAEDLGATDYMTKPIKAPEITRRTRRLLGLD